MLKSDLKGFIKLKINKSLNKRLSKAIEGPGAYPAYVEFWAVFFIFAHICLIFGMSYKLIGKHSNLCIYFRWFSLRIQDTTYAKNVGKAKGFF